jgi:hypothetical protein
LKINGEAIPDIGPDFPTFFQRQLMALPLSKTLSYTVLRKDDAGTNKETVLSAPVKKIQIVRRHNIEPAEAPTPEQLALRESWLKP